MTRLYIDGDGIRRALHNAVEMKNPALRGFWTGTLDDGSQRTVYRTSLVPEAPGTVVDVEEQSTAEQS